MVKIAVLGYGIVGSGVVDVIYKNSSVITNNAGCGIDVKYILDIRDFPDSAFKDKFVKDFGIIENDPEIKVVVETIGGTNPAYDFTKRALLAGKSVITSNKELVACHGAELIGIARERNLNYLFEASVGGGIPVLRPISQCLVANELDRVCGILNGTTNYILTRMIEGGLSFEKALCEAQEKGYAERNPEADIEGHDACRKICILAALAFGKHVYPEYVETEGITGVSLEDVRYAESDNKVIKLLGRAIRLDNGKLHVFVGPHLVEKETPLASVKDVFNAIVVHGNAIGEVMFYGRGAGKYPTASAVVADVIDAVKHLDARKYLNWEDAGREIIEDNGRFVSRVYIRAEGESVRSAVTSAFGEVKFIGEAGKNECAFITRCLPMSEINEKTKLLSEKCRVISKMKVL
ncbi:MAG: homoserine dehydrogenase [Clostridiales bacterium]|jgi:homoserine dehydrogenase|nr:homoserine dehydrogenase [Clostridiales bacterium]